MERFMALYWGRFGLSLLVFWPLLWADISVFENFTMEGSFLGIAIPLVLTLASIFFCATMPFILLTKSWVQIRAYFGLPPISR